MKNQVCLVPILEGVGGIASFQAKFINGLTERQIPWTYDLAHPDNRSILVIGGTRHLWKLKRAKARGARIVQRLNGINWMHKVQKTPVKAYLRSELNNLLLAFIRRRLADRIIYQSKFSRQWWKKEFGVRSIPHRVVYNGIDLESYHPAGPETPPAGHYRILLVEGHLSGAYAQGLLTAVQLAETVKEMTSSSIELMVAGEVDDNLKARIHTLAPTLWISWLGIVPRTSIPGIDRSAHVLFSADLNAACPNSVIEAMGCGCPIVAYDTGALSELVQDGAGEIVPYGSNHWQLEDPVIQPLADACIKILEYNPSYRQSARERAENIFGIDQMVEAYLDELIG